MRARTAIKFTLFLLAGCSAPGVLVSQQAEMAAPVLGKAAVDGAYGLFIAGEGQELVEYPLKAGDALGFAWGNDAELVNVKWMYAVAGSNQVRLDVTKAYEWRRMP